MATATPTKKTAARGTPAGVGERGLDERLERLNHSIEAAEAAAKDVRAGVEKGTRDLVRDLERTLKHARTNARRVGRAVAKDVKHRPARRRPSSAKKA
jgi:hypothetical protein